jgi:pyruvate/2-oxoglutarate dehydrogenase complex dihydrolipoamide acyltransferase (E2) component
VNVKVRVRVAQKYTGFGRDVKRLGQAIERKEGDEFTCPETYAEGLVAKGFVEYVGKEEIATEGPEPEIPRISEAAQQLADNSGLAWKYLTGTGRGGTITVKDVRAAIQITEVIDENE